MTAIRDISALRPSKLLSSGVSGHGIHPIRGTLLQKGRCIVLLGVATVGTEIVMRAY